MIRSINRTLDILQCVADGKGEPVSVHSIAKATGLNKATICHITETLVDRGFLIQISRSSGYVLGIYAYNLTRYQAFERDLVYMSEPVLEWIRKKTGCNALLAKLINGEKFILKYVDVPGNELSQRGEMYRGDLYNSATGLAMLSGMKEKEMDAIVKKVGLPTEKEWPGMNDLDKLKKEIRKLKEKKVIVYRQPVEKICLEFAVAFEGKLNEHYAVGLGYLKDNEPTKEEVENIEKVLLRAKKEIMERMHFE